MSVSTAAPSRARLYYERRGSGPLLLLIGSPMDSVGFAPLASALADRYTKAMQKFLAHAGLVLQPEIVTLLVRDGAGERTRAATGDDPVVCGQPKITRWPRATA
jgi:hypothetical protein